MTGSTGVAERAGAQDHLVEAQDHLVEATGDEMRVGQCLNPTFCAIASRRWSTIAARSAGTSKGFMGHRAGSQAEVCATGDFPTIVTALESILSEIEALSPGSLHRANTGKRGAKSNPKDDEM